MGLLENLKYEVAFNSICYAIKQKNIDSKEIFDQRINFCKGFFESIITGLESLTKGEYHLVENLELIVNLFGYEKISEENMQGIILDVRKTIKNLDKLKESPQEFYNSNESERLYTVSRKIKEVYSNDSNFFEFA